MSASSNLGFPPGYFIIRSVATDRVLDIEFGHKEDGSRAILWPAKDTSLVEDLREGTDNQEFFIDDAGYLCSRASGHAIDVEDGELVLRHRRPVTYPYPNSFSHPLPHFSYSPTTGHITVTFVCDPSFPAGHRTDNPAAPWRLKTYVLTSVARPRQKTVLENTGDAIANAVAAPLNLFGSLTGLTPSRSVSAESVREADIDLREEEVAEEDKADAEEIDNSTDVMREVHVVAVDDISAPLHPKTVARRRWEVIPLRISRVTWRK